MAHLYLCISQGLQSPLLQPVLFDSPINTVRQITQIVAAPSLFHICYSSTKLIFQVSSRSIRMEPVFNSVLPVPSTLLCCFPQSFEKFFSWIYLNKNNCKSLPEIKVYFQLAKIVLPCFLLPSPYNIYRALFFSVSISI